MRVRSTKISTPGVLTKMSMIKTTLKLSLETGATKREKNKKENSTLPNADKKSKRIQTKRAIKYYIDQV